jgi:endonuclease/exonuclease/phosphatase family metal-dependent hydrolase
MSYPLRFTVCTANLWGEERWPERQEVLRQFLDLHRPDLLCLQELSPAARQLIDLVLPGHSRVEDDFPGWLHEGNIFWNDELFELTEYGAEQIGQLEELRRLFWVRLRLKAENQPSLTVATAHYSWPGSEAEKQDGINRRFLQAQRTTEVLNRLTGPEDRLLFMGDFNEYYHPLNTLREAGLQDCFSALGRIAAPTYAVYSYKKRSAEVLDWILQRGPLQPMTAEVVDFYAEGYALSDHRPVLATYRLL